MKHNHDFRKALRMTAEKVELENQLNRDNDEKIRQLNGKAIKLFSSDQAIRRRLLPDDWLPVELNFVAIWRVKRKMRKAGFNWEEASWENFLMWIYENWDSILRTLLSILILL